VIQTLSILWNTFGITGFLSVVASAAAIGFVVKGLVPGRRFESWLRATILAAVALGLAMITSSSIRSIEVDRSAEQLAAEAAGAKAAQEKLKGRAADIRFAEDTVVDQADVAGVTVAEEEGAYERAVAEQLGKIPAYRRGGRKERSAKKQAQDKASEDKASEKAADAEEEPPATGDLQAAAEAPEESVRKLPEADLIVADRFDRINRGLTWSVLTIAVGLVSCEWLRRFNTTFDAVWPLPLAGTVIDGATPKAHVVAAPTGLRLADFLPLAAAKGESFIVFAADDPLVGRDRLDRFAIDRLPVRLPPQWKLPLQWRLPSRWSLPAGWRLPDQWRLPVQLSLPVRSCTAANLVADPSLAETVFESAWFGRSGFIVLDGPDSAAVLASFAGALERRRHCRAAARRTLNLVWALPSAPDAAVASRLERLAAATNVRWVSGAWA
jgi:hypothetical protein